MGCQPQNFSKESFLAHKIDQNKCHSEPNPQRLTYEESQKPEILRKQIQRSHSQNDITFVGADSISARQRGITLIALVVTLVVLLILAGITIDFAISEGGIIAKAQSSKEKQEVAVWLDRLTVTEANTAVTHYAVDMEKYNAQLKNEGIVLNDDSNYQSEDGGKTYNLTTDNGYVFNISEPTPGDIVINYIGKNGELLPYIKEIKVINTTANSSKIEVDVARLEAGKLTYEYKKHAEENYTMLKENKELTAEFTGLTQKETYDIKVTAENKNGKSEAKIISIYTGELASGTISQKGEIVWSNEKASIELQTTDTENTMQYQKNGIAGSWTNYTTAITALVHGDVVYARMFDGINGTSPFSISITEDVDPQTATINLSKTTTDTATPITATVIQVDNESGVDVIKCKWVYNTTSGSIGTAESNYTGGFNSNPQTISLNANTAGTYYLHVLTIDKAGNKKESVSTAVVIELDELTKLINKNQAVTENTTVTDKTGKTLTIPAGFKVLPDGQEINKGVVIEDPIKGNQFVWVPVPDPSSMYEIQAGQKVGKLYDFSTIGSTLKAYPGKNTGFREPDVVTGNATGNGTSYDGDVASLSILGLSTTTQFASRLQTEFNQMIASVEKYKGFYIGRYSTGNLAANTNTEPVVKKGQTAISSVNWYYIYQNSKKIASGNSNVVTSMMWGCQYDRTLQWLVETGNKTYAELKDSRSWGNYKDSIGEAATGSGSLQPTGSNEAWKANNIYDLTGNVWKWTTETYHSYYRVLRGGIYCNDGGGDAGIPASSRYHGYGPDSRFDYIGSASTLIIK